MLKPTSQPCLRNQDPIFQKLQHAFSQPGTVLELACGTAQHGVYFAQRLPYLTWQATDLETSLTAARLWIKSRCMPTALESAQL